MESLGHALLFVVAAGLAIGIGLDVVNDVQNRTTTATNIPFVIGTTRRGRIIGGVHRVWRDHKPFDYWSLIGFKIIALAGLTFFAAIFGYFLVFPN